MREMQTKLNEMCLFLCVFERNSYGYDRMRGREKRKELKNFGKSLFICHLFCTFVFRKQCSGLSLASSPDDARGKSGQHRASHFRN